MAEENTTQSTVVPAGASTDVARMAIAWEITRLVSELIYNDLQRTPEDKADQMAKIFAQTVKTLRS